MLPSSPSSPPPSSSSSSQLQSLCQPHLSASDQHLNDKSNSNCKTRLQLANHVTSTSTSTSSADGGGVVVDDVAIMGTDSRTTVGTKRTDIRKDRQRAKQLQQDIVTRHVPAQTKRSPVPHHTQNNPLSRPVNGVSKEGNVSLTRTDLKRGGRVGQSRNGNDHQNRNDDDYYENENEWERDFREKEDADTDRERERESFIAAAAVNSTIGGDVMNSLTGATKRTDRGTERVSTLEVGTCAVARTDAKVGTGVGTVPRLGTGVGTVPVVGSGVGTVLKVGTGVGTVPKLGPGVSTLFGLGVSLSEEELVELLSLPPRSCPALRTKTGYQEFFKGMNASRMKSLLEMGYDRMNDRLTRDAVREEEGGGEGDGKMEGAERGREMDRNRSIQSQNERLLKIKKRMDMLQSVLTN